MKGEPLFGAIARVVVACGLVISALGSPLVARAQGPGSPPPLQLGTPPPEAPQREVAADVSPVLSDSGSFYRGLTELVVRIRNRGAGPIRGEVKAHAPTVYGGEAGVEVRASFAVGAESSVSVALPVRVLGHEVSVTVVDDQGREILARRLNVLSRDKVSLVDVDPSSRLRAALDEMPLPTTFAPLTRGSTEPPALLVSAPRPDPATGDPVLPERAAGYSSADVVLMKSDVLIRLDPVRLEALAGFVLSGGTLALVVARPEDLHHDLLARLVGGEVEQGEPPPSVRSDIVLTPLPPDQGGPSTPPVPSAEAPSPEIDKSLVGYYGGNLVASDFGASATYGLGEVILLAFDPSTLPGALDPWVLERTIDMSRRAYDRRSTIVFRQGEEVDSLGFGDPLDEIRRQLDPNENTRWAIALAALLLCLYSVLAGPVNFSLASKRGKPLSALRHLPLYAVGAFAIVVAIGISAKGIEGRARHIALIEAGGGAQVGTIRRYRGFYTSRSEDLTVSAYDRTSVLGTVRDDPENQADHLLVDRSGLRLTDVTALPWQTVVVREDGFSGLGGGVTLASSGSEIVVENKTGRDLRGALLRLPGGDVVYFAKIASGERVTSAAGAKIGATHEERTWLGNTRSSMRAGRVDLHPLFAQGLDPILESDAPGLDDAWLAIERAGGDSIDWFPADVPVLLAQIDGGEGRATDAGLTLESDRLLLRVVGYGGTT